MAQFIRKTYPKTAVLYLFAVIIISIVIQEPVAIIISLFSSMYSAYRYTGKKVINTVKFSLIILLLTLVITPLTVHKGGTVLFYLPWGNPVTAEATVYALFLALSIASVILWSSVFSEIVTSDKLIALFGGRLQNLAAILSLTMTLFPRFASDYKKMYELQKLIHGENGKAERLKLCITTASGVFSRSLENGITTAMSMKARGFGSGKRSVYIEKDETDADKLFRLLQLAVFAAIAAMYLSGTLKFNYFAKMGISITFLRVSSHVLIAVFYSLPMMLEGRKK